MADVFLSYKRDERTAIEQIASRLRALGLTVWFDASMSAGETFNAEIDREARAAKAVLVCWSPAARLSEWVNAEAMIGFEQKKLAACYVAGPDGFSAPTPFNTTHAEDLRAWLATGSETHPGWKSVLRRIGKLCGRPDIESWGALDAQANATELRGWIDAYRSSPLFMTVDGLLRARKEEEAECARLEQVARDRRVLEEAERRAIEQGELRRRGEQKRPPASTESSLQGAASSQQRGSNSLVVGAIVIAVFVVVVVALNVGSQSPQTTEEPVRTQASEARTPPQIIEPPAQVTARPVREFDDCNGERWCPRMVVVPGGSYIMGSPNGEQESAEDEGPPRRVTIREFAVSKFEITRGLYEEFVRSARYDGGSPCYVFPPSESGRRYRLDASWREPGFPQSGNHPVVCVSWHEAEAYVAWLNSRIPGARYHLLSEAEWEYVARAGSDTPYPWGTNPHGGCGFVNTHDVASLARFPDWPAMRCNDGYVYTAPVGMFQPNAFGIHDLIGNAAEWVADCYTQTAYQQVPNSSDEVVDLVEGAIGVRVSGRRGGGYDGYPTDGSAYTYEGCGEGIRRGGGWDTEPQHLRSALRESYLRAIGWSYVGFRVAREM